MHTLGTSPARRQRWRAPSNSPPEKRARHHRNCALSDRRLHLLPTTASGFGRVMQTALMGDLYAESRLTGPASVRSRGPGDHDESLRRRGSSCPWPWRANWLQGRRRTPTLDELCGRAVQQGVVKHISRSYLQRSLYAGDIRLHRVQQGLHSPDPKFRDKVIPSVNSTAKRPRTRWCGALTRKPASRPSSASVPTARYSPIVYAAGSSSMFATASRLRSPSSGRLLGRCSDRRTQADLVAFTEEVARAYASVGHRSCRLGQPEHAPREGSMGRLQRPVRRTIRLSLQAAACQLGQPDRVAVWQLRVPRAVPSQSRHRSFAPMHRDLHCTGQRLTETVRMDICRLELKTGESSKFSRYVRTPAPRRRR